MGDVKVFHRFVLRNGKRTFKRTADHAPRTPLRNMAACFDVVSVPTSSHFLDMLLLLANSVFLMVNLPDGRSYRLSAPDKRDAFEDAYSSRANHSVGAVRKFREAQQRRWLLGRFRPGYEAQTGISDYFFPP